MDLNVTGLSRYLDREHGLSGGMNIEQVSGGQSNPTFFVTCAGRRMVLRKQPPNALPSAHAIDREYRIMGALARTTVPVPGLIGFCDDASILGTAFYLMERVDGRVFSDPWLPGVSAHDRRQMYMAMAEVLAALNGTDWQSIGLEGFGRPGQYFARQIDRFAKQWELSREEVDPDIDAILSWLRAHIPQDEHTTIVHGDFRIGNLMFHPVEPRIVAVLDWELSTLGHPAADLAYSALGWRLASSEYLGMCDHDLPSLGIPTEHEFVAHYFEYASHAFELRPFHTAFALFRLAIIFEGIAARSRQGTAVAANAAGMGNLAASFARAAVRAIS